MTPDLRVWYAAALKILTPAVKNLLTPLAFVTVVRIVSTVTATRTPVRPARNTASIHAVQTRSARSCSTRIIPGDGYRLVLNFPLIERLMRDQGLNMTTLAAAANMSRRTLTYALKDKHAPSDTVVGKLSRALGCHPTQLSKWEPY